VNQPETPRFAVAGPLIRACHPEPTIAVTAALTALAVTTGRSAWGVVAVAAAILAGQLSIGWSNDWLDAARDTRTGRRDKPIPAGQISAGAVRTAALLAVLACIPLSLLSGLLAALVHMVTVACGWAYNVWLKSSVLSPLPYAVAFGAVPAFVVLGLPGSPAPPLWLVATCALLGTGAHFANVIPDLADDAATGIRGLPHRLGATGSALAAGVLLGGATAVLAFGPPGPVSVTGLAAVAIALVVLTAGFARGRRPGSRAPFRAVLVVAVLDIALLLVTGVQV
jgi:4-hydroxybenzoate polyprenyltransferase